MDVAAAAGIEFEHRNGARGQKQLPETMGSGVAFFDYDDDGWLDLYWVNVAAPAALYHNEGNGLFAERTQVAGVGNSGCGMGAVAADYDNDGDADLYITCYGANILYRNRKATAALVMPRPQPAWATRVSALERPFGDWDLDGDLDLYVANYLDFRADPERACFRQDSVRVYCAPWTYAPEGDVFYRNDGGRFAEVGAEVGSCSGSGARAGRGLCRLGSRRRPRSVRRGRWHAQFALPERGWPFRGSGFDCRGFPQ